MKVPTAQEIIDIDFINFDFVEWYNYRLKFLNKEKKKVWYGRRDLTKLK